MTTEIENTKARIQALRAEIGDLERKVEEEMERLTELVRPFIPLRPFPDPEDEGDDDWDGEPGENEPPSDNLVIPGYHDCVTQNPAGTCVYDDDNDPAHDFCLFCGGPEERL